VSATARPLAAAIALTATLSGAGCGTGPDQTLIRLGHGLDPSHPVHLGMVDMAERLAAKSGGRARIEIFPGGQLGSERELLELLQIGSLGMTKVSSSVLEQFVPAFRVFGLPYLFRDDAHRYAVLEGPIGRQLLLATEPVWLRGLTYYDAGTRSFYTTGRPIAHPRDLRGLKIRTQESATAIRMVNVLGGAATPIAFGELYTALQQGVVDGAENNPPSYHTSRHYEVARYYSLDEHTAVPDVLLVSSTVWASLDEQTRQWLQEAADESHEVQKRLWREATERALAEVRAAGVTVLNPDKRPFREGVAPMYDEFRRDPVVAPIVDAIDRTP
jgi:tripartite ATP-independent transporter DctP family solute receptor